MLWPYRERWECQVWFVIKCRYLISYGKVDQIQQGVLRKSCSQILDRAVVRPLSSLGDQGLNLFFLIKCVGEERGGRLESRFPTSSYVAEGKIWGR